MISPEKFKQFILENCVDDDGDIVIDHIDLSDFNGDVYIRWWAVKNDLFLCCHNVGGNLNQAFQTVGGDLDQCYQKTNGNLYQGTQKVYKDLDQSFQEVGGNLIQHHQKYGDCLYGYLTNNYENFSRDENAGCCVIECLKENEEETNYN